MLHPVLREVMRDPLEKGRGGGGFSPAQVYAGGAKGLWLDPSDISTAFQDSAGTTPVTASGQFVGKRLDKSGRGIHLSQTVGASRPEYDVIGGISSDFSDGTDDGYSYAAGFVGGTLGADMDVFVAIKTTDTSSVLLADASGSSRYLGAIISGDGATAAGTGTGTPTMWANGVQIPGGTAVTRASLCTAVATGAWVIYETRNIDLSAWVGFVVGSYTGFFFGGDIGGIIACPAQSTANRNNIRRWLGAKVGLSL